MQFQTFSVVVGTRACNASCPFCISKQTGFFGTPVKVNWRNFHVACNLASKANTTTVLLTGKGEPTLYPDHITDTLKELQSYKFPLIEMQTNGITIANGTIPDNMLDVWYDRGLTTIALSVVHWDKNKNGEIYQPEKEHFELVPLIDKLHNIGFSVRLCVMLLKNYIDTNEKMQTMIDFAKVNKVEQLTFRNITTSSVTEDPMASRWTQANAISAGELVELVEDVRCSGKLIHRLMHGMDVYSIRGQNVCLGNCLTSDPSQSDFRQLIFFPDGSLYWDWQYKGARIL